MCLQTTTFKPDEAASVPLERSSVVVKHRPTKSMIMLIDATGVFMGMCTVALASMIITVTSTFVSQAYFDGERMTSLAVPLCVALSNLPTALTVMLTSTLMSRCFTASEAHLSASLGCAGALCSAITTALSADYLAREWIVLSLFAWSAVLSVVIAPFFGYVYSTAARLEVRGITACVVGGTSLAFSIIPIASYFTASTEIIIGVAFLVAFVLLLVATQLLSMFVLSDNCARLDRLVERTRRSVRVEVARIVSADEEYAVVYNACTSTLDGSNNRAVDLVSGPEEARMVLRRGWAPLLCLFCVNFVSNSVFPSMCVEMRPSAGSSMSPSLFLAIVVYVIPNLSSLTGNALGVVFERFSSSAFELTLAITRGIALFALIALSNYRPYAERTWVPILLNSNAAFMLLLCIAYLISGYLIVASFDTLRLCVGSALAPRAAKLGAVITVIATMCGIAFSIVFPLML
jgi:hypothetical protein